MWLLLCKYWCLVTAQPSLRVWYNILYIHHIAFLGISKRFLNPKTFHLSKSWRLWTCTSYILTSSQGLPILSISLEKATSISCLDCSGSTPTASVVQNLASLNPFSTCSQNNQKSSIFSPILFLSYSPKAEHDLESPRCSGPCLTLQPYCSSLSIPNSAIPSTFKCLHVLLSFMFSLEDWTPKYLLNQWINPYFQGY